MELFTHKELIIMGFILGFSFLLLLVFFVLEILVKKKKKNIDELEQIEIEESNELQESKKMIEVKEQVEVLEIEPNEEDKLNVIQINDVIIDEDLPVEEKVKIELSKFEEQLEHEISLEDTITNLETIEEESAIISYQELISNTNKLNVVLTDDGNEPISIDEVFKMFDGSNFDGLTVTESLENISSPNLYQNEFQSSPYVSPITGIQSDNLVDIKLENTANLEKLDRELRKTNEFLNILNELKKNLE